MKILPKFFSSFEEKEVVKVKNYKFVKKIEIIDTNTLDRYKKLSMYEMARKAMFIFLFTPALLALKVTFNVLQMVFDCSSYFFTYWTMAKALGNGLIDFITGKSLVNKNISKVFELSITSRVDIFKNLAQDTIYIVRAPFFAIALQFASLFILVSPNRGRKAIAKIEKSWNYNMGLSYDYRHNKDFKEKSLLRALFETLLDRKEDVVFYLALCFQPRSLKDKHVIFPLANDIKK